MERVVPGAAAGVLGYACAQCAPACVSVAAHNCGPVLALETLGCWCVVLVLETGDVVAYYRDFASKKLRRLDHGFGGRPAAGAERGGAYSLAPLENAESRSCVFVAANTPALLVCDRGIPALVAFDGAGVGPPAVAPLASVRGFLSARARGGAGSAAQWTAAVAVGLGNLREAAPGASLIPR